MDWLTLKSNSTLWIKLEYVPMTTLFLLTIVHAGFMEAHILKLTIPRAKVIAKRKAAFHKRCLNGNLCGLAVMEDPRNLRRHHWIFREGNVPWLVEICFNPFKVDINWDHEKEVCEWHFLWAVMAAGCIFFFNNKPKLGQIRSLWSFQDKTGFGVCQLDYI